MAGVTVEGHVGNRGARGGCSDLGETAPQAPVKEEVGRKQWIWGWIHKSW